MKKEDRQFFGTPMPGVLHGMAEDSRQAIMDIPDTAVILGLAVILAMAIIMVIIMAIRVTVTDITAKGMTNNSKYKRRLLLLYFKILKNQV